jgi:hypothetical protein
MGLPSWSYSNIKKKQHNKMPVKINFNKEEFIKATPLPTHGNTYSVIPHGVIIEKVKEELAYNELPIERALYKSTQNGEIATGTYHISYGYDPDIKMMFAWSNSYNKQMRFKCAVGSYVSVCMNGMINGDMGANARKHRGATALQECFGYIESQLRKGARYYDTLVQDKEILKNKSISKRQSAEIVGRLFAEEEILTLTQLGIVQREMKNPSFQYNADQDSAWYLYNHITHALKESHPAKWLDDHAKVHQFFVNEYGQLVAPSSYAIEPVDQLALELEDITSSVVFL